MKKSKRDKHIKLLRKLSNRLLSAMEMDTFDKGVMMENLNWINEAHSTLDISFNHEGLDIYQMKFANDLWIKYAHSTYSANQPSPLHT